MFYINNISHIALMTGQSKTISLSGFGIVSPVGIVIGTVYIPASFVNSSLISFVVPYISTGTYDVTVFNGDGKVYTGRQWLTVTDPLNNVGDLGSAVRPIVLAPRIVEAQPSSIVKPVLKVAQYNTPASVFSNTTGQTVASKTPDPSVEPQTPVNPVVVHPSPASGTILETPFGIFNN